MLYSFEVFDTCLTRICAEPQDLFLELGRRLASEYSIPLTPEAFLSRRVAAEAAARAVATCGECTLEEICAQLVGEMGLPLAEAGRLAQRELALEMEWLRPVPDTQRAVAALHVAGQAVVYISDTYLPAEFIEARLLQHGFWAEGDRLYTSNAFRCNKTLGGLYAKVRADLGAQADQWRHCGDDVVADIEGAKRCGISGIAFAEGRLSAAEGALRAAMPERRLALSRLAGAARLARLNFPGGSARERLLWDTTADVVAPMLCAFVAWCLARAEARGLRRLYFVSRDGEILCRLAEVLRPWLGSSVEVRYLYGSRQAWHLPSVEQVGGAELDWMLERSVFLTVESVLARVAVGPEEIAATLEAHGYPPDRWRTNLVPAARQRLRAVLLDATVSVLIQQRAAEARAIAVDYFRQEQLHAGPCGLVDVGWSGRALRSLRQLHRVASEPFNATGLYFALLQRAGGESAGDEAFFFDVRQPADRGWIAGVPHLIELFLAAGHGPVHGYVRREARVEPRMAPLDNAPALRWGVRIQQEAAVALARSMVENLEPLELVGSVPALAAGLRDLALRPSAAVAELYGGFLYEEAQVGGRPIELGTRIRPWEFGRYFPGCRRLGDEGWWPGSVARSGAWVRWWAVRGGHSAAAPLTIRGPYWWRAVVRFFTREPVQRVAIFGASRGGEKTLRTLSVEREAVFMVDNDGAKQGTRFHGLPVHAPAKLLEGGYDRVLIGSVYALEIREQLLALGVPEARIEIAGSEVLKG